MLTQAPCPVRPPSTNAFPPMTSIVPCPLYGATDIAVVLSPTRVVTGVTAAAFSEWLWSVAGMCTQTASLTQDTTLNTTYFDAQALKSFTKAAVPLDPCRLPGGMLVTLHEALPDVTQPSVAHTTRRLLQKGPAFCVYGVAVTNYTVCSFKDSSFPTYNFCKGDTTKAAIAFGDMCTVINTLELNFPVHPSDPGTVSSYTNGLLTYPVRSTIATTNTDFPSRYCDAGITPCTPLWNTRTPQQHTVKCRVTPPSLDGASADSGYTNDDCLAGVTDGNSGSLCAGLQCDPRQSLGITPAMYGAQGARFSCLPWGEASRNTNGVMQSKCFAKTRNAAQQQSFPVSITADVNVPVASITVPAAMVMFSTVEAPNVLDKGAPCACSSFDASLCECPDKSSTDCTLPSGQDPGISDGQVCREWCGNGDTNAACVADTQAVCGPLDAQDVAECACVNALTTQFPGMAGKTHNEFVYNMAVNTGAAAPASVGPTHCWWQPCQQAINATGAGSYLPTAATTGKQCTQTNAVCAVNIVGMNVLRTQYNTDPSQANADAYAAAAASIYQSCQLCPPPPNVPIPVRPAGCPTTTNVCDCPGVDKAACMQQNTTSCQASSGVWNVTVYNTGAQVATVSTSTSATSAINVNPGDTHAFRIARVVPGEQLTVLWGVSNTLSSNMTGAASYDVQTADNACIATYKTSAVVVVGYDAAAYAARVKSCTPTTCVGLPPLQDTPSTTYTATITVANFTGSGITAQWDASGSANAVHAVPAGATQAFTAQTLSANVPVLLNGGTQSGGLRVSPVRFTALPSVTQLNTQVWAGVKQANGTNAGVLAVFPDVVSATAYAQLAEAASGKLPMPIAPGGGSAGVQYTVSVQNFTAVPAVLALSGGTPVDVDQSYTWTGGILTSIVLNKTSVQMPTQSPSVTTATVKALVGSLPQIAVVVTQDTRAVIGVYATVQDAQAYTQLVLAAGKALPPPAPSSLPKPKPSPDDPGTGGGGTGLTKVRKTLKWLVWVVFAVLVCASIPLLVIGGVRNKRARRRTMLASK